MSDTTWADVDDYFGALLAGPEAELRSVVDVNAAAGLPPHDVTLLQGKFLHILARIRGAQRILEIGTLGGFSTIWLARALPPDGSLVTLEVNSDYASTAKANCERAGVISQVSIQVGDACESLSRLHADGVDPFDFVFIDADKRNNVRYFRWALRLASAGAVIVVDNVVRNGDVLDESSSDPSVRGVRAVIDEMSRESEVVATALQTVGLKGYDGFVLALVSHSREDAAQ